MSTSDATFIDFPERFMRVNGIDMNVLVAGSGPDVLLVRGFPDDHTVWRKQIPVLVAAGFRVIAPDMRGCGETTLMPRTEDYRLDNLVADVKGLLDALGVKSVRLVGHDWGAVIGWHFCFAHPEMVDRYVALSVGHPTAYATAPLKQKLMGTYILVFQLRGIAEWLIRRNNWQALRVGMRFPDEAPNWIAKLKRPGRLTAALRYYRANIGMIVARTLPRVSRPVMGVWSDGDIALCEEQMSNPKRYLDGPWRYERIDGANHWLQLDAAERTNALLRDYLK